MKTISLIGYKKTYSYANNLKNNILLKLKRYGKNADDLNNTVKFILGRNF